MAFGSGNFDSDDEVMSEINMTPLVDVMLVLLIIFMVTMPVITHAVKIELPQATSTPEQNPPETVDVVIDASGNYLWNNMPVSRDELEAKLAAAAQQSAEPVLRINADKNARYDPVAQVLAAAQRAGLHKVGVVTQP
ncbi:MAG: biopolymer transporter ExbD [Moraxellaceae bacterium]|jgi:biopolymer transport protein ExbD|nr:biopolymer transporter ExbD [Moraxellaceae bacterium]